MKNSKKYTFFVFVILLFLQSCKPTTTDNSIIVEELKAKLESAKQEVATLKSEDTHLLMHTVYLKPKPGISESEMSTLISEIKKLASIEVLKDFKVGTFKDLEDARAMSDYTVVFQMGFKNEADYKTYQAHPVHLKLKENLGGLLGGPPVTHDFLVK